MTFQKSLGFLLAFSFTFICSSHATTFQVGGKDGWTLHPSESYSNWSSRLRFLINDTLHFKYDGRLDSVLVVNKGDYDGCNTNKPITKLDGGDSSFKFDRSGPFYFISGNKSNCNQGQKLIVVVLALRIRSPPPSTVTPPVSSPASPPAGVVTPPSPSTATPPAPVPISPVLPPSPSTITPVSPSPSSLSPSSPSSGSPELTPPAASPGGAGGATSPRAGGSTTSPGAGGSASAPGGSNPADVSTPPSGTPPSSSPPSLSGTATASLLTMIFAVWWWINY